MVVIKNKKLIIYAILGLLAAFILWAPKESYKGNKAIYVKNIVAQGSTVASRLKQDLSQEHEQLLSQIKKNFEISDEDWNYWKDSHAHTQTLKPLTQSSSPQKKKKKEHPIIEITKECLTDFGINPELVTLRSAHLPYTPAQANQNFTGKTTIHIMELDFEKLSKKSRETQKAIIGHEIQHLIHYDPLEMAYITNMLQQYGYSPEEYSRNQAMIDYCHHIESRADLLSSVIDIRVAQAFKDDFKYDMALSEHFHKDTWLTHPSDKQRYNQLDDLIACIKLENNLRIA